MHRFDIITDNISFDTGDHDEVKFLLISITMKLKLTYLDNLRHVNNACKL